MQTHVDLLSLSLDQSLGLRKDKRMLSIAEDAMFQSQMQEILQEFPTHLSRGPSRILPDVFLGNYNDAHNLALLSKMGITHIVNCAAWNDTCPYKASSGLQGYLHFKAEDSEEYDILQHFAQAKQFIDAARDSGGKVLVHCAMGVNRAGAISVAYVMMDQHINILEAVKMVKKNRNLLLLNQGFQRQLIKFARKHKCLPRLEY